MLTNTQAREAKPRTIRYEITCDALPGFILRVLPTGKKVFFARYRDAGGKDRRFRLGLMRPGFGVEEARREAMTILARSEAPASEDAPEPTREPLAAAPRQGLKSPTLAEFALRFEQEHIAMRLKPGTARNYRSALSKYILPALGERSIDDVTTADVQRLHNSLRPLPCAANYARLVLSVMFTKARKWGVTRQGNPVADVERFGERAVERFLTPEERQALERVLAQAERTSHGQTGYIRPDAIAAIRLLALTGMRHNEVCDLCWEHVDWRQKMLRLPDSKTGKRDVVVSDEVMALLGRLAQAKGNPRRGLVVCSRNGRKLHSLKITWPVVRKRAGIPDVRLHDLRHSVASDAIMDGVPLEVVGKMLGHRNYRTTQRYAHIADTALREAVNRTSKTIVRAARGKAKPQPAPNTRKRR